MLMKTLERRGHKADGGQHAGAAADPVEHGEAGQPALCRGGAIHLRAGHRDGHLVPGEFKACFAIRLGHQQHAVAGVRGATALGSHEAERFAKPPGQPFEGAGDAVRVGVVDELDLHLIADGVAQGVGDEHRTERGAADANGQHASEP